MTLLERLFKYISTLFITVLLLAVAVVLFLLYSPKALNWTAKQISPAYHISYKTLSGSLHSGLSIQNLRFKNKPLLDKLEVTWNPFSLLTNSISIHTLTLSGLNIEHSKNLMQFFTADQQNSQPFSFPLNVDVAQLSIDSHAFEQYDIGFKHISVKGKALKYYGHGVNINDLNLTIESNVTDISLTLKSQDKTVEVSNLKVLNVDTVGLQSVIKKMIAINLYKAIQNEVEPEVEKQRAGLKNYLPQTIQVDNALFTVKDAEYPHVHLKRSELELHSFFIDIYKIIDGNTKTMQVSDFSLFVDSNFSTLKQKGFIKDSHVHSSGSFNFPHALMNTFDLPINPNSGFEVDGHSFNEGLLLM